MEIKYTYVINPFFPGNSEGVDFKTTLITYDSLEEAYNTVLKYLEKCKFQNIEILCIYKNCEDVSRITVTRDKVKFKILIHFYEVLI